MSQSERIVNRLREVIEDGAFYARTYDRDTRAATVDDSVAIPPSGVIVNEVSSQHGPAVRNRISYRFEKRSWRWRAVARFDQEVCAFAMERALTAVPPRLDRDEAQGLEQVILRLVSVDYLHPVQQSSSSGSQVIFSFEADLSPS